MKYTSKKKTLDIDFIEKVIDHVLQSRMFHSQHMYFLLTYH